MSEAYITYARRTPIGKWAGQLSGVRVDDLLAYLFNELKNSAPFPMQEIDDVIVGCANQAGEDNRNIARMSLLLAGLPETIPGSTVNRLCGSSLDALIYAASTIKSGYNHCVVVGGAESMSRAPYVLSKADTAFGRNQTLFDTALGWRFPNPHMEKLFPLYTMGETAEEVAKLKKITRMRQDEFAYSSQQKAAQAQESGAFSREILPIEITDPLDKKKKIKMTLDEGVRKDTTLEKLSRLKPVFRDGGSVTAGNSSGLNDGASCLCVVSESFLKKHRLKPLLRVSGMGVQGVHPNIMGLGPVGATQTLMRKFSKKISDFDAIELNEAFAAQVLACMDELKINPEVVNRRGGAIALGHPLGSSGARMVVTLAHLMEDDQKLRQALATMCIGVGQGIAMSFESCF